MTVVCHVKKKGWPRNFLLIIIYLALAHCLIQCILTVAHAQVHICCDGLCLWQITQLDGSFRSKRAVSTSSSGPLWPVGPVRQKLAVPLSKNSCFQSYFAKLSNQNFSQNANGLLQFDWKLFFNPTMSFYFLLTIPLVSDCLVWQNGKHPYRVPIGSYSVYTQTGTIGKRLSNHNLFWK